jgi:CheY-like chemotaxis protein
MAVWPQQNAKISGASAGARAGYDAGTVANVLIIDDDGDSGEAVATYLSKAGHAARVAPNGREALPGLSDQLPDAILLDVRMPVMDGVALLEVLRSYLRWSTVPVALFTAYGEDPRLKQAASMGVSRVFHKSKTDLSEVLAWVEASVPKPAPPTDQPPAEQFGA